MIKNKMSITQSYFLAHTARRKLSREAARPDHNLRLLVGHANMLDTLMYELAEAEAAQEKWFQTNLDARREEQLAEKEEVKQRHIQWADAVKVDVDERDLDGSDSESSEEEYEDSEYDEDEEEEFELLVRGRVAEKVSVKPSTTSFTMITAPASSTPVITTHEILEEEFEDNIADEEADLSLALHRTSSHIHDNITVIEPPSPTTSETDSEPSSPPLLTHDMSSDSEESDDDDLLMMPPSPKDNVVADPFTGKKMTTSHTVSPDFYTHGLNTSATIAAY